MSLKPEKILRLLADQPEPMLINSMLRSLGGRHLKSQLKQTLNQLIKAGQVVRLRGERYSLAEKAIGMGGLVTKNGIISIHRDGYGFVKPDDGGDDVFVPAKSINNALHGDSVTVRVEPDRLGRNKLSGRVLAVQERANSRIVGRIIQSRRNSMLIPEEQRLGVAFMIAADNLNGAVDGQQAVLEVTAWPAGGRPPEGRVLEVLGWPDDPEVEVQTIIRKYNLPHRFEADTMQEAEHLPQQVSLEDLADRVDLRQLAMVTIDGETAKDFDDAVCIRQEDGNFRLWVAIADVSHYVKPHSHLDREAYIRGNSVYFPDRCLPMLPELLSNGICSLNPGLDRLTVTAELLFDQTGQLLESNFYPSVICSVARLTYTQVKQVILDGDATALVERFHLVPMLNQMKELALLRMARRQQRGSLDFDLPEPEVVIGTDGQVEAILKAERNLAHQLIEEFMLAANEAVASFISRTELPFIYRIHEPPALERLINLRDFILPLGYNLEMQGDRVLPAALQRLISEAEGKPEERLINYSLLRCMKQARYAAANLKHFGLASDCYTHFTAPIRRYPDLLVHRLLKLALAVQKGELNPQQQRELEQLRNSISDAAEHCSSRERLAMEAERDLVELKKLQFMQNRLNEEFDGFVSGVTGFGCFVELTQFFVEGLVHISTLQDDYYSFNEPAQQLVGQNSGKVISLGDQVRIKVVAVDPQARRIEFTLLEHTPAIKTAAPVARDQDYQRLPIKGKRPGGVKPKSKVTRKGNGGSRKRR